MKKFNFSKGLVIGLLTMALCLTCFGYVKASADEAAPQELAATYTAATDSITVTSGKYVVYVLKQESNNTIKAGATCYSAAANAALSMADLGIKVSTKDVYLYVCNKEFAEEGKNITANMVIKAPAAAKVVGVIDYTKADGTDPALSIIATDKSKKEITDPAPVAIWSKDGDSYEAASTFTGDKLAKMLSDGGATIFVKMQGVSGASGTAQFSSKAVKVKIAKPAKAPAVKLDVAKDAFAIKNGFDFAVAGGTLKKPAAPAASAWFTILPVLANAETKTAADSIVATSTYKPLDKKDTNAKLAIGDGNTTVSYTQYKFKNISAETLLTKLGKKDATEAFVLAVRKSATNKKPASEIAYVKIVPQTKAPIVLTESKVKDQYLVASSDDFSKKGIVIGSVINYPGTTGSDSSKALATTGFDATFKVVKATNKDADDSAAVYEYLIVKTDNLGNTGDDAVNNVDLSTGKWKKFNPAKLKLTSKLKSKYSTVGGKAVEATLKAIDKPDSFNPASYTPTDGVVILVRRAGVKGKTAEDSVRASKYETLYVIKDDKTFELYTKTQIGAEAWQYKVQFAKYDPEESTANKYIVDDEMTLTGWVAAAEASKSVDLTKPSGFDYFPAGTVTDGKTALSGSGSAVAETAGKYSISIAQGTPTVTYCIKQYANIVITVEYEPDDDAKISANKVEIKAGKLDGNYVAWVGVDVANIDLSTLITTAAGSTYDVGTITTDATGATVDSSKKLTVAGSLIPSAETVTITVTVPLAKK